MSEGPTIGDWTQYGWIPDDASAFPARVRLRNAAWMVYYEPDTVVQRVYAENAKLRELVKVMPRCWNADCDGCPMSAGVTAHGGITCTAESRLRELVVSE